MENSGDSSGDSIVDAIRDKFLQRSLVGQKKYNHTMDRGDLTQEEWITHLQEELMDAILYAEKAIAESKRLKENPNQ